MKSDLRVRLRAVSLFLFFLLGLPPSFFASRGFAAQRSRARALSSLNLKKKRDCSQSSKHENSSPSKLLKVETRKLTEILSRTLAYHTGQT